MLRNLKFSSIYCSSNVYQHWCHHQLFHLSTSAILSKIPEKAPSLLRLQGTDNCSVPNSRNIVWPLEKLTDADRFRHPGPKFSTMNQPLYNVRTTTGLGKEKAEGVLPNKCLGTLTKVLVWFHYQLIMSS